MKEIVKHCMLVSHFNHLNSITGQCIWNLLWK